MIITILAGGWSASKVDLRRLPGKVIAVNDAAYYAPRWDICISMDRLWAENRWAWIEKQNKPTYLRRSTLGKFMQKADLLIKSADHVMPFFNDHTSTTLTDEAGSLNGTHSGFCALNLAYQMRPNELYLVGFDMQLGPRGERHWYRPYPWANGGGSGAVKLFQWSMQFSTAARQLDEAGICVRLVNRDKSIGAFKCIDPASLGAICA